MKMSIEIVLAVLVFSSLSQALTVCSSSQKNQKGQPKFTVEYYRAGELTVGLNSFSTILFYETELRQNRGYVPVTYSPCSARPSGFALLVKCDSSMGSAASLLIENASRSGAFQDGPLKLFNMSCSLTNN